MNAHETATKEYDDAIQLAKVLIFKLKEGKRAASANPKNWGHAGTAAHIRGKLEELLAGLYGIDADTEEEINQEVRRQAGITVIRNWS